MRKIIFLDIDGVLVTPESGMKRTADMNCVYHLNNLVGNTGAKVVVSSSWRGRPDLQNKFIEWGCAFEVIGETPRIEHKTVGGVLQTVERGYEIQKWLDDNKKPLDRFVILDDDADMVHLKEYLIQTDYNVGLTEDKAFRAQLFLNGARRNYNFPETPRTYA